MDGIPVICGTANRPPPFPPFGGLYVQRIFCYEYYHYQVLLRGWYCTWGRMMYRVLSPHVESATEI